MPALAPTLVTPPADTPITLAEAKEQCRVQHNDEDSFITGLVAAAVARIDAKGELGRCLVTQTWSQAFGCWPGGDSLILRLPFCDIATAGADAPVVKYSDTLGVEQTVDPALYQVLQDDIGTFIWFKKAFTWPNFDDDRLDPIRVTFKAGYGDASKVPADIKAAIKLMVASLYENREDVIVGQSLFLASLPMGVEALLSGYRRVGV